ncbi:MAG: glycosyltransferase family 4 protein [Actinobacteria bacterium]|nr:glycosyltransferase family 4 protein [Actinomycetota bacterium]
MKVIFLSRFFYPHIGGVEKHVQNVGASLVKRGHEVTVITEKLLGAHSANNHSISSSAKHPGKVNGMTVFQIHPGKDDWFKKIRIWKELWKYKYILKQADIIHCHDVFFWYLPFRFVFPYKKVYITFHGYEGNKIPGRRAILSHKIAEKLSKGNICIGDFFKKWYGTNPTIISYGAVDTTPKLDSKTHNSSIKNVLYIGRLEEEAGIMEYLRAVRILKDKGINLKLTILGDGSQMKKAQLFAEKNRLDVVFKGFVENVDEYVKKTDIVFVSRYLGILESLVNKKLVFAVYNNDIKKDYLETAKFKKYIYISSGYLSLASDIQHVILNKDYDEKIKDGYSWAKKQSWEKLCDSYLRLWRA